LIRLIPKLEIKGPNLVKGVQLEGLRVLGKPWDFAKYYFENGADELIYQDVVASLYGRNSLKNIIEKTAKEIFIPLTVGGGIRSIEDIENVLHSGADKVSINTMAIISPSLIKEAVKTFGSSTIVVSIEYLKVSDSSYFVFTDNGREHTGVDIIDWIKKIQDYGAGEVIITSIERDGTGKGFDIELISKIKDEITIPLIINGGAGEFSDIEKIYNISGIDGVALGSILHYSFAIKQSYSDDHYNSEGNIDFVKTNTRYNKFGNEDIGSIKNLLSQKGFECRI
jgi:imidazole glycerol-phosphate synthase subunit HisF